MMRLLRTYRQKCKDKTGLSDSKLTVNIISPIISIEYSFKIKKKIVLIMCRRF